MSLIVQLKNRINNSRLLSGVFWTLLGNGFSRLFMMIGTVWCANILGVEKYGEFGITRSTINLILTIAGLNIGTVLTKYISEFRESDKKKCAQLVTQNYVFVLIMTVVLAVVVYFIAPYLSTSVLKTPQLTEEIQLSVVVLFFGVIYPLNEAVFRGFEWFKALGIVQAIGAISFLLFVPLFSMSKGVYGAILGYLIFTVFMTLITAVYLYVKLKKEHISLFVFDSNIFHFSQLSKMSIPILLASIIEAPFFWYSQVLLVTFAGMIENGKIGAIMQIRSLILIIPSYISLVTLPLLSNTLSKNDDNNQYKNYLKKSMQLNFGIALICIIPFLFFSNDIMKLFGKDFQVDFWTSFYAYISIPFFVIASVMDQSLIAKGKAWTNFYISIFWNSIFIALIYVNLSYANLGGMGYMLSMFIAILVLTSLKYYYNSKANE
ncbi:oligosaccharide flippase family protein [Flavobacterium urocaniciphilum]|uniref:Na+-driven multidrug efflux pump n=1 Tax=Flavobacterium urocaniciphilum TaxID=1299341 RepID=A0A1H8YRI4_9FLAO|nr:oligosaccharide flippase family protein [Flavobacterium urocaniciphilum]SEP54767.1 Na+-driven multidrug efflux pump [Flavobacterium urocaniciphilum]